MKILLIRLILWTCLTGLIYSQEHPLPDNFPTSDNPVDFQREVKDYILYSSEYGVNVDRNEPHVRQRIAEDPKDWETSIVEIIGNSEQYGMTSPQAALIAVNLRKKGNDPRVSAAAVRLFQQTIQISTERLDEKADDEIIITGTKAWVASLVPTMLQMESPDVLQSILVYLSSPEADRLESIQSYTPKYLAPALQKYGDLRNVEEAERVATKLASIGRADVASDIKRAAEGIRKDAAAKETSGEEGTKDGKNAYVDNDLFPGEAGTTQLWPWLAAGAALIAALVTYFRKKR